MEKSISFEHVVDMVKENTLKHVNKETQFTTTLNSSDFQLIKIVDENKVVLFHLPTKAKVRVKVVYPYDEVPVEVVEVMPEGKKRYNYIADYILNEYTPSIFEKCYKKRTANEEFSIGLFCSL